MTVVKLDNKEIQALLDIPEAEFEKYVSPILNLANRFAQGTRAKVVGQMSELVVEFPGRTFDEWTSWYSERNPDGIEAATNKIRKTVEKLRNAMAGINDEVIERWVKDLVLVKTFTGLRFQEAILKKTADYLKAPYRRATVEEEAKNIDGYIGEIPVSIKADTYRTKDQYADNITVRILYYSKHDDGLRVDIGSLVNS